MLRSYDLLSFMILWSNALGFSLFCMKNWCLPPSTFRMALIASFVMTGNHWSIGIRDVLLFVSWTNTLTSLQTSSEHINCTEFHITSDPFLLDCPAPCYNCRELSDLLGKYVICLIMHYPSVLFHRFGCVKHNYPKLDLLRPRCSCIDCF